VEELDSSQTLYYLKITKGGYNWRPIQSLFSINFKDIYVDIYNSLAQDVKLEIQKEFNSTPEQIKELIRDGRDILAGSIQGVLNATTADGSMTEGAALLQVLRTMRTSKDFKQYEVAAREARKISKELSNYFEGVNFFSENNLADVKQSIEFKKKRIKGGEFEKRLEDEWAGAIQGLVSNLQGAVVEMLVSNVKSGMLKDLEGLENKKISIQGGSLAASNRQDDTISKADSIIKYMVNGSTAEIGISIKTYLRENVKSYKALDQGRIDRFATTGSVKKFLQYILFQIFNPKNKNPETLPYRKLLGAIYADFAVGGISSGRALSILTVVPTKGNKDLKVSVIFLNEYFEACASRASATRMIPYATKVESDAGGYSTELKNYKLTIFAPIIAAEELNKNG
jgi:hypothetical protein